MDFKIRDQFRFQAATHVACSKNQEEERKRWVERAGEESEDRLSSLCLQIMFHFRIRSLGFFYTLVCRHIPSIYTIYDALSLFLSPIILLVRAKDKVIQQEINYRMENLSLVSSWRCKLWARNAKISKSRKFKFKFAFYFNKIKKLYKQIL